MSLRTFHGVFIGLCLTLLAFTGFWASGWNPQGIRAPWLVGVSLAGAAIMAPYLRWYLRSLRLPA